MNKMNSRVNIYNNKGGQVLNFVIYKEIKYDDKKFEENGQGK